MRIEKNYILVVENTLYFLRTVMFLGAFIKLKVNLL